MSGGTVGVYMTLVPWDPDLICQVILSVGDASCDACVGGAHPLQRWPMAGRRDHGESGNDVSL